MDQYANANPGTVVNTLTKLNSSRQAVKLATTDTTNIYGICLVGCGNSSNAQIAFAGQAACKFDGQTVVNDFVVASTTVAGDCNDAGSAEPTGVQVVGRVIAANSGAATNSAIALYAPDVINASPVIKTLTVDNASSTGTTLNKLAKLTGAPSKAVVTGTSDTQGAIGIVTAGAGTSGQATIVQNGLALCVYDGATTAGDYAQISATVAGDCHDSGATYPTTGEVIGRIMNSNGGGGTYNTILGSPDVNSPTQLVVVHPIGATFDGGGSALTVGTKSYFTVPYACTIQAWNATVDAGTITFGIWKIATGTAIPTVANSIIASAAPAISSGTAIHSTTMTSWTTSVAANDIFAFNISAVATATKASITLQCQ